MKHRRILTALCIPLEELHGIAQPNRFRCVRDVCIDGCFRVGQSEERAVADRMVLLLNLQYRALVVEGMSFQQQLNGPLLHCHGHSRAAGTVAA